MLLRPIILAGFASLLLTTAVLAKNTANVVTEGDDSSVSIIQSGPDNEANTVAKGNRVQVNHQQTGNNNTSSCNVTGDFGKCTTRQTQRKRR
jgi:hypothetical protein